MPTVRIGGADSAATIGLPVRFRLNQGDGSRAELSAEEYDRLAERVYSSVATELYSKIDTDVRDKAKLFPTPFLRTVALAIEA